LDIWNKILNEIKEEKSLVLICVLESAGSSPGRKGFKMYVTSRHEIEGSIGGGIMEHKLIELAKNRLETGPFHPFIKKQIHRKDIDKEQSGMICSGEQIVAFYYFDYSSLSFLEEITSLSETENLSSVVLNQSGYSLATNPGNNSIHNFQLISPSEWQYTEVINHKPVLHIIGGGHVGLALSQVMQQLSFYVKIYDERNDLNTMDKNFFAHEKHIVNFQNIIDVIPYIKSHYVVIMSFGYRTDELCIKQLLQREYKYFGVMGSQHKMNTLFESLLKEGNDQKLLDKIYTPIGVQINSQTPMEIAISVAAEIIAVKNGKFLTN